MVATDRISAFDSVLPCGIPNKGLVLNQFSVFWFEKVNHILPSHMLDAIDDVSHLDAYVGGGRPITWPDYLVGRSMVVIRARRLMVECVVRGYIAGSAWVEYQQYGTISGEPMPVGLRRSQELPQPLFTPTTKEESGHDEPITMDQMRMLVGEDIAEEMRAKSLAIYGYARDYARSRGIIIADTKMEFGFSGDQLLLIDELLTPDSSRFWDADLYRVGQSQPSLDKQPVRDWLVESGWDKEPPAPMLPEEVIAATADRYQHAYERLTGEKLSAGE
jgi:phosphoribosylaminoimidazole-succinocarboxamide synthase